MGNLPLLGSMLSSKRICFFTFSKSFYEGTQRLGWVGGFGFVGLAYVHHRSLISCLGTSAACVFVSGLFFQVTLKRWLLLRDNGKTFGNTTSKPPIGGKLILSQDLKP